MEQVMQRSSSFFLAKLFFFLVFSFFSGYFLIRVPMWCADTYQVAKEYALQKITRIQVVREYIEPEAMDLDQAIAHISKLEDVTPLILRAIAMQESAGGKYLYRFEPQVYQRIQNKIKTTEDEKRMLASSHGAFHIMGYNASERCDLHWSQLYDNALGAACAMRIIKQNYRAAQGKTLGQKLRAAIRAYNGSGPQAEQYADKIMGIIAELTIKDLGKGLA